MLQRLRKVVLGLLLVDASEIPSRSTIYGGFEVVATMVATAAAILRRPFT